MQNRKKKLLICSILMSIFTIAFMTTYAFFNFTKETNEMVYKNGDVFMKVTSDTDTLTITNVFPDTYEHALYLDDNYIEFNVNGLNTYEDKLIYGIKLVHANLEGYTEEYRILDKYLRFELTDITNSEYILFSNYEIDDLDSEYIYVDSFDTSDTTETRRYRLRMWITDTMLISDTDSNKDYCASSKECNDSTKKIYSDLFASIKVEVYGDYNSKYGPFVKLNNVDYVESTQTNFSYYLDKTTKEYYSYTGGDSYVEYYQSTFWPMDDYLEDENGDLYKNTNAFSKYLDDIHGIYFQEGNYDTYEDFLDDNSSVLYSYFLGEDDKSQVYLYIEEYTGGGYDIYVESKKKIMLPSDCSNMFAFNRNPNYDVFIKYGVDTYNDLVASNSIADYGSAELFFEVITAYRVGALNSSYKMSDDLATFMETDVYKNKIKPLITEPYEKPGGDAGNRVFFNIYESEGVDNFIDLTSVKEISLDYVSTGNVTDISNMFMGLYNLESLDFSNFNTCNVTNMEGLFSGVGYSLTGGTKLTIDLTELDTGRVTNMAYMLSYLNDNVVLEGVEDLNVVNVKDMRGMFSNCDITMDLDLTKWDVSNVEKVAYIPVTSSYAYSTDNEIFSGPTSDNETTTSGMFSCSGFTSINLNNWNISKVTSLCKMFKKCEATSIYLNKFVPTNVSDVRNMFDYCQNLTTLEISSRGIVKNVTDLEDMFYYCSKIQIIDMSWLDLSNVVKASYAFYKCSMLTTIYACNSVDSAIASANYSTVFDSSLLLVGQNGSSNTSNDLKSFEYLRLDEAIYSSGTYVSGNKGLLTYKANSYL